MCVFYLKKIINQLTTNNYLATIKISIVVSFDCKVLLDCNCQNPCENTILRSFLKLILLFEPNMHCLQYVMAVNMNSLYILLKKINSSFISYIFSWWCDVFVQFNDSLNKIA